MQSAGAFSNPETTIILIHVIIIQRSSQLDINDENSYNKAEKTLKSLENKIRKIHPSAFGEIIQARHAGAASRRRPPPRSPSPCRAAPGRRKAGPCRCRSRP